MEGMIPTTRRTREYMAVITGQATHLDKEYLVEDIYKRNIQSRRRRCLNMSKVTAHLLDKLDRRGTSQRLPSQWDCMNVRPRQEQRPTHFC